MSEEQIELVFKYFRERGMPYYSYTDEEKIIEFKKIQNSKYKEGIQDGEILQLLHGIGLAWSYFPHHWEVQVMKMK